MTPPEMIFLIAVTVVLPITVLSILFSYQKARLRAKHQASPNELTTSELRQMIEEAVADATTDLEDRMKDLEHRLRLLGPPATDQTANEATPSKTLGGIIRE